LEQFLPRGANYSTVVFGSASVLFGQCAPVFHFQRRGLNIVEPVEAAVVSGMVVNLASWSDDSQSGLEVHEPEATDVVITLGLRH